MNKNQGKLYLIPTTLSDNTFHVIAGYVKEIMDTIDDYIVENEKSARHFLKGAGYSRPLNQLRLSLLNKHTSPGEIKDLIKPLVEGKNVGVLSEAGCPGIADPGADIVHAAHQQGIDVIPLVGPSSVILALMASGLNGQSFTFHGYIPKERTARIKVLKDLEKTARVKNQTQLFIETPFRNQHLLEDILQTCDPETLLCIACDITGKEEFVKTKTIREWKKKIPDINKKPAIFLIGSSEGR